MKIIPITAKQNKFAYKYNNFNTALYNEDNNTYDTITTEQLSLANFPNISFRANPDKQLFMQLSEHIGVCAYSGRLLLSPKTANEAYMSLEKRYSAQDAINFLIQYRIYMLDKDGNNYVEGNILDLFRNTTHKNKKNFQDILLENRMVALENLKNEQRKVLISADPLIDCIEDSEIRKSVQELRNETLYYVETDHFSRKTVLEKLYNIKGNEDQNIIKHIIRMWYKLPRSADNTNAFIVKYCEKPHDKICNRLLSSSVNSIEHVIAASNGGPDELGNFLPVASIINNLRSSMPITEFDQLNRQLRLVKHLYEYVEKVKTETNRTKSPWHKVPWYLNDLQKNLLYATEGRINIDTEGLQCSQKEINYAEQMAKRLKTKYILKP